MNEQLLTEEEVGMLIKGQEPNVEEAFKKYAVKRTGIQQQQDKSKPKSLQELFK